ncbi:MAG: riboflavin biosynthesis protein RibF [Deltaproteobacteria bacterium]|nr:riboflavin biosynthesis protein RibF [Deltaproteobacteria bacterium]
MAGRGDALVMIGNFDGVHRGHQAVLAAVRRLAAARGLRPTLLTFQPHPLVALGRKAPPLLTTLDRKRELLRRYCPNIEIAVREFDRGFAALRPAEFARTVLVEEIGAAAVMVGTNFRFGHKRSGDFVALGRLGAELGFEAHAEPLVADARGSWSSSRIRGLVAAGRAERASELLGRPHMLSGPVVPGDRRGRTLGFPTCNISGPPEMLPAYGAYAVLVDLQPAAGTPARALAPGVANIGIQPTVAGGERAPLVEVHLLGFDGDLYGQLLRVHLVARLREERRCESLEVLRTQIGADVEQARDLLAHRKPDPDAGGAWA